MRTVMKYKKWFILFLIAWINLYMIFWITKQYGYQGFLLSLLPTALLLISLKILRKRKK